MSEIQLNVEKMREMKIFLATPMYGGMCNGMYTKALMDTATQFMTHGLQLQIYYLFNESLITRARNYCVHNFLESDCTHMLFIDSDISWRPLDLMYMLHLMVENPEMYRILCGLYPKKTIAWEKIIKAAKTGNYDDKPWELEKLGGDMVFNPLPTASTEQPIHEPIKIAEGATGFMLIERSVFKQYGDAHPELLYTPDHLREGEFTPGQQIHAFFDCIINDQNRYLSEDYMFSEYCRNLGIDIWALPLVELMHCGAYVYQGNIVQMANANVSATVDAETLEKIQKSKATTAQKNSS